MSYLTPSVCYLYYFSVSEVEYEPSRAVASSFALITDNICIPYCISCIFILLFIFTVEAVIAVLIMSAIICSKPMRFLTVFRERTRGTCLACWVSRSPRHLALATISPAVDIASGQSVHTLTDDSRHSRATPTATSRYSWRRAGAYSRRLPLRSLGASFRCIQTARTCGGCQKGRK